MLKRIPAILPFRLPDCAQIVGLNPITRGIQVGQAIAPQHVAGRWRPGFGFIALLAPAVRFHRGHFAVQEKAGWIRRFHANRLAFMQVNLGGGRGKSHRAFHHGDAAPVFAGFQPHARAAEESDLRARHGQSQRVLAFGPAGEVRHAAVERKQRDALARGEPRVVGDLALAVWPQAPRAAFIELDFQA